MTALLFSPVLLLGIWVQAAQTQEWLPDCERGAAICQMSNVTAYGTIRLLRQNVTDQMKVYGEISGLTPGPHGFHVHEYGDLGNDCANAGAHLNPFNNHHGAPSDVDRHMGDLGNIEARSDGVAPIDKYDRELRFCGPNTVYGRAIVVHALRDDLGRGDNEESLKTGNSGARIGCCIIQPTSLPQ